MGCVELDCAELGRVGRGFAKLGYTSAEMCRIGISGGLGGAPRLSVALESKRGDVCGSFEVHPPDR